MDPILLHHGISEGLAFGLLVVTAVLSFAAGVVATRHYDADSHDQIETDTASAE